MITQEIQDFVTGQIEQSRKEALYNTKNTTYHTHNGIDSPKLDASATSGVSSVAASGSGISASPTTGNVVIQNTGVTSLVAGSGISVSGATGAVTVTSTATNTIKTGWNSRSLSAASSVQTIAHGLGKTPSFVRINGSFQYSQAIIGVSTGTFDGTTMNCVYSGIYAGSGGSSGGTGNYIIVFNEQNSGEEASITVDATNISLSWTLLGGSGINTTGYFTWEVQ